MYLKVKFCRKITGGLTLFYMSVLHIPVYHNQRFWVNNTVQYSVQYIDISEPRGRTRIIWLTPNVVHHVFLFSFWHLVAEEICKICIFKFAFTQEFNPCELSGITHFQQYDYHILYTKIWGFDKLWNYHFLFANETFLSVYKIPSYAWFVATLQFKGLREL